MTENIFFINGVSLKQRSISNKGAFIKFMMSQFQGEGEFDTNV